MRYRSNEKQTTILWYGFLWKGLRIYCVHVLLYAQRMFVYFLYVVLLLNFGNIYGFHGSTPKYRRCFFYNDYVWFLSSLFACSSCAAFIWFHHEIYNNGQKQFRNNNNKNNNTPNKTTQIMKWNNNLCLCAACSAVCWA